jgi:hypothetical protein
MKRRRIFLVLTLVLAAVVTFIALPRAPKEPFYKGKGLSQWIASVHHRGPRNAESDAREAINAAGPDALPYLLHLFTRPDPKLRRKLGDWLWSLTKGRIDIRPIYDPLGIASTGIRLMGTNAAPAWPVLADYFGDPARGGYLATAMRDAGEAARPYVLNALASTNVTAVNNSLYALQYFRPLPGSAIPPLASLLEHTNTDLRVAAAYWLRDFETSPNLVVCVWSNALSSPDPELQLTAIEALIRLRAAAHPVFPDLVRQMTNSNSRVAHSATNAVQIFIQNQTNPRWLSP